VHFIKNHISGDKKGGVKDGGGVSEEMESKMDRTACAASCCPDCGGGWAEAVSDTLSTRQATTDMTYCSFIPFTALRKWRGTGDSLCSGHLFTELKRNPVD